ncbi:hypothetical protein [Streptomyces sp. NPDC057002]|uniref:hypothetical protein n=1 Tax=Streptomyces sp. NPDC057002 TaxID=3345992 RepID=UPI00362CB391
MISVLDGMNFSARDWQDAYGAAEENGFDEIDARENGGELAAVVASFYTHDKVGQDEGILYAAIQVLSQKTTEWVPEYLETVLNSYDGESEDDLKKVATDYIEEQWPGFPVGTVPDLESFARTYAIPESRVFSPSQPGGTLHYFDTNKW